MKLGLLISLTVFIANTAIAQSLSFQTASVKPGLPDQGVRGGCHGIDSKYGANQEDVPPLGQCVISNGRLSHFVMIAWGMATTDKIESGPNWVARGNDRDTIEAQAEDRQHATEDQLLERSGFALVVGKEGAKLQESTAPHRDMNMTRGNSAAGSPISLVARRSNMDFLADRLSGPEQGDVINKTGLPGEFDFTLTWSYRTRPSLNDALQEQLGLSLVPQLVSVPLFEVDSAQKPATN
jgi:hypothetical protein